MSDFDSSPTSVKDTTNSVPAVIMNDIGDKLSSSVTPSTQKKGANYYDKGSVELVRETPVMLKRMEKRRTLTGGANGAERLLIVLVGLPARGKSFIARKLLNYMTWRGNQCRIFNVGKYRRRQVEDEKLNQSQNADFFDDSNHEAALLRQKAAEIALKETLEWLQQNDFGESNITKSTSTASLCTEASLLSFTSGSSGSSGYSYITSGRGSHGARRQLHKIAIFDATNSTDERRQWILKECAKVDQLHGKKTGVMFLESICDDEELLAENLQVKIKSCPDFDHMSPEEALADLKTRIAKYESRYETMNDYHQSFIKIFNFSSRLMVNHIYGRLAKVVLPAIMAWNTGSRPIFLCRSGETRAMEAYMKSQTEDDKEQQQQYLKELKGLKRQKGDRLGERGRRFRDRLSEFIEREGIEFMERKKTVIHPSNIDTGTSISGLSEKQTHPFEYESYDLIDSSEVEAHLPFPCLVMSSTMPRAVETATWRHPFPVKDVCNLNPLDMGDFAGKDLATLKEEYPEWYARLQREPFHTRFPGGESYSDLIDRISSIIVDMEQQLGLAVVISHVSVLQVLVSYFRGTPIQECMDIEIPMHTVLKFTPLRGGGWLESQHPLLSDEADDFEVSSHAELLIDDDSDDPPPIWGDSRSCLPIKLETNNNE